MVASADVRRPDGVYDMCPKENADRTGQDVERRKKLRIAGPHPAWVRGVDASGQVFEGCAVFDNFSAGGFYLRLRKRVEPGAKLFAVVRLGVDLLSGVCVAIRGVVLRVEQLADGTRGIAVALRRYRFL